MIMSLIMHNIKKKNGLEKKLPTSAASRNRYSKSSHYLPTLTDLERALRLRSTLTAQLPVTTMAAPPQDAPPPHATDAELFAFTPTPAGDRLATSPPLFTFLASAVDRAPLLHHSLPLPSASLAAFRVARAARALTPVEDRALGAMLGMAVGDALGAPLEFLPYEPTGTPPLTDGGPLPLPGAAWENAFGLKYGQWTDDTAMGLCLADSLLAKGGELQPLDLMLRFLAWWEGGVR